MSYTCSKCEEDLSSLINWDTLTEEYIECPKCNHKMTVEYDESWDGEEETQYWWVEDYCV